MALGAVDRDGYLRRASELIAALAARDDWAQLLRSYEWAGEDWRKGLARRAQLNRLLNGAGSTAERLAVLEAIVSWGGLKPLGEHAAERVMESLAFLDEMAFAGSAPPSALYADRIATVSKVYAMHDPTRWTIYDSRVARGLGEATSAAMKEVPAFLKFPQPPGRTGEPAPGFPALSAGAHRQARLGFCQASWLLQEVARRIPIACPDGGGWDVRHVEMALFMLGRPGGDKATGMATESSSKGGKAMAGAAIGATVAREVWNHELTQALARDQLLVRLEQIQAKQRAARFAAQTGSQLARVQYADGPERWTIFREAQPIAAFPPYPGDLNVALAYHELNRIEMREADSVQKEIEKDNQSRKLRLPGRGKKSDADEDLLEAEDFDDDEELPRLPASSQ